MSSFLLEIITPKKVSFSDQVEMVTAPTSAGIIGVLSHHVPLFTRLVEGEIKISKANEEIYFAIGGGFMEITKNKVIILVTDAYHAEEINEQEVLAAKKRAEEALAAKPEGAALLEAQSLFKRSVIALKVLHRRRSAIKSNPT